MRIKRWQFGVVIVAAALALGYSGIKSQYGADISATQARQTVTFTDGNTGVAFNAHTVRVKNKGANEVFVEWRGDYLTTATAGTKGESELQPGEQATFDTKKEFNVSDYKAIALICSAGETATVRVEAFR